MLFTLIFGNSVTVRALQIVEAQYEPIPPGQYSDRVSAIVNRWVTKLLPGGLVWVVEKEGVGLVEARKQKHMTTLVGVDFWKWTRRVHAFTRAT